MESITNNISTYSLIKEGLNASVKRGQTISNNIANINTKGYKRFDVVFEENLKKVDLDMSLKVTKSKHIPESEGSGLISVKKDESTSMRADGNNVDLDVEKTNQAANLLKYNALISKANGKLSNLQYVITGGGK